MLCIKYCAPGMEYIDEASQIRIDYRPNDETLEKFIEIHPNQTIYIDIGTQKMFESAEMLKRFQALKQYPNWVLQLPVESISDKQIDKIDNIKFAALKDCCNRYMFTDIIGSWEVLQYIFQLKPCEVYITNILGFSLDRVKRLCDEYEIGVRVFANVAQSAWNGTPALKKFFIRPEDVEEYEKYTSGIEFQGDATIQEVMYKVYRRGYWYGDISEIIIGFEEELDSRRLPREFGEWRLKCGKRCITGGSCGLCRALRELADRLDKTDTVIIPKAKDKE